MNTEPTTNTSTAAVDRPAPSHHDAQQTNQVYRAYVACFADATQALLHLAHTAGIAVAYLDRGSIEAERGGPLTEEQWEELTYQLDEYDEHVSFDDTNSVFLDQIFSDANIPRRPEDEDGDEGDDLSDEDLVDDELDDDEVVAEQQ